MTDTLPDMQHGSDRRPEFARVGAVRPKCDRRDPEGPLAKGIYDIRGFGAQASRTDFDDLLFPGRERFRYPLEGYRERCDTMSRSVRVMLEHRSS